MFLSTTALKILFKALPTAQCTWENSDSQRVDMDCNTFKTVSNDF